MSRVDAVHVFMSEIPKMYKIQAPETSHDIRKVIKLNTRRKITTILRSNIVH